MCIFGNRNSTPATPPPLPPAAPPPLPPIAPVDAPEPVVKEVNPQVKKRKKETADKEKSNYTKGTGALKIKLDPKLNKLNETINTGVGSGKAGGLN